MSWRSNALHLCGLKPERHAWVEGVVSWVLLAPVLTQTQGKTGNGAEYVVSTPLTTQARSSRVTGYTSPLSGHVWQLMQELKQGAEVQCFYFTTLLQCLSTDPKYIWIYESSSSKSICYKSWVFKHAENVDWNPSDHRTALTDTKKKKLS